MTKFEDQLYTELITEHGHHLRALQRPAPARRRVRRPVWLATGAAGAVAAGTVAVMALGSAPALAAYSVTRHDGAITVAVNRSSGVAGANMTLHGMVPGSGSSRRGPAARRSGRCRTPARPRTWRCRSRRE